MNFGHDFRLIHRLNRPTYFTKIEECNVCKITRVLSINHEFYWDEKINYVYCDDTRSYTALSCSEHLLLSVMK